MSNTKLSYGNLAAFYPYLACGVAIFLLIGVFVILSYVLFWGFVIGIALFIITRIKLHLSSRKTHIINTRRRRIIIEHYEI